MLRVIWYSLLIGGLVFGLMSVDQCSTAKVIQSHAAQGLEV
jgi:hypothetical protein